VVPLMALKESTLDPAKALHREIIPAGEPWMGSLKRGQHFRIVDLEGNQAVDTLFYSSVSIEERYSAQGTIRAQGNIYLTSGTRLLSNDRNSMLTIVADTCGRHDTLSGACSAESHTVRYGIEKRHMHSCRDNFLLALARWGAKYHRDIGKRDLASNINFFMPGISAAGRYVEMRADMDVTVLISNCPLPNPQAPIEVLVWDPPT
jgi:uncharacterized protein